MWVVIAARITSDTGRFSTLATISRACACSSDRRTVIALACFMRALSHQNYVLVKRRGVMVSRCQLMEVSMSESQANEDHGSPHGPKTFEIKIDRTTYKVDEPVLTGAQLRALPN